MVCRIADNPALEALRRDVEAPRLCHSQRVDCIHRLPRASEQGYYGISGAFLGYCQALFEKRGGFAENTLRVTRLLESAGLPWARSHELFYGHKSDVGVADFVSEAAAPLRDLGRVPILITGLDMAADAEAIRQVIAAPADVVRGETVLVRTVLRDDSAFAAATALIRELVVEAQATHTLPAWWPLLQAGGAPHQWEALRRELGPLWSYVNIAINPFSDPDLVDVVADQLMVAQYVVPHSRDIHADGTVEVSEGQTIAGAAAGDRYNLHAFSERLARLRTWPTSIFLGPTLSAWSDKENLERVVKIVDLFRGDLETRWRHEGADRYLPLLEMAA